MQIPKFPLWLCALTVCGGMTLRADDNAAQAAARAALQKQMQAPAGQTSVAPKAAAPVKTIPKAMPRKAVAATVPVKTAAPVVAVPMTSENGDTPAQAAARAALQQQMHAQSGNASVAPKAVAPAKTKTISKTVPKQATAVTATAPVKTAAPVVAAPMTSEIGDTPAQAAARAALQQQMQATQGNASVVTETSVPAQTAPATPAAVQVAIPAAGAPLTSQAGDTPAQASARAALSQKLQPQGGSAATSERQIIAPPPPVNMSKLDKLHWLNSIYEANQLSPEQYQAQRAAIMAAP